MRRLTALTAVAVAAVATAGIASAVSDTPTAAAVTIFPSDSAPKAAEWSDHSSLELGVRFSATTAGSVTAIRFYKFSSNTGSHTGSLWSSSGTRLASGTFSNESSSGWQTLSLATPVRITANTAYVASYHAPAGQYAQTLGVYGSGKSVGNATVRATAGLYAYGSTSTFPKSTWNGADYGVDVRFQPAATSAPAPAPAPPTVPSAPTSAPTTSPSAPSSGGPLPNLTGWPNASNTGVRPGTTLVDVPGAVTSGPGWRWDTRGWVSITGAGTVFSGYRVHGGAVEVYAPDVTVTNNDVENDGNSWGIGIRPGAARTVVSHNTVHGPCLRCTTELLYGIKGDLGGNTDALQVTANNVYWTDHPLQSESGDFEDNYVHGLSTTPNDTDHVDCFFTGGGYSSGSLTLRHNALLNDFTGWGSTSSILLSTYAGRQMNRLIENNLLGGGGYTVYGGYGDASSYNVVIRDNQFTTAWYPKSGKFGPLTAILPNTNGNSFTGNVWADGPNAGRSVG